MTDQAGYFESQKTQQPHTPDGAGGRYPPASRYGRTPTHDVMGPPAGGGRGLGITALVLGIVGLSLVWIPAVDLLLGTIATIFGAVGLAVAIKRNLNKGMAIAGLALGVVTVIISLIYWFVLATAAGSGR